ncbi:MAG: uroporphyrinogen-III synthase, partial [Bacteroidota bacterium]
IKKFDTTFDGYLFYSPSGIRSFLEVNTLSESPLFCIGETTAQEAKKHSENLIVANKPTVENVLVQVAKHFKKV